MSKCQIVGNLKQRLIYCLGQVGITLNTDWEAPKNPMDPADWDAAERGEQFHLGWFANPIFGDGDYPQIMRSTIDERSMEQGLPRSRLPHFTPEDKTIVQGKKQPLNKIWSYQKMS